MENGRETLWSVEIGEGADDAVARVGSEFMAWGWGGADTGLYRTRHLFASSIAWVWRKSWVMKYACC
jgi:hypothetical protein